MTRTKVSCDRAKKDGRMKSILFFALALSSCHAENFLLKGIQRAFTTASTEGGPEMCNKSKTQSHGLEVISAGVARTGSASLQKALNILGYTSYHNSEVLTHDHSELWDRVVKTGGKEGIEDVVSAMIGAGYDATTDSPSADFSMQLLELYPNAKVILSTRPDDRWLRSVFELSNFMYVLTLPPFSFIPKFERFLKYCENLACIHWQGCLFCDGYDFDINDHETNQKCLGYFHSHNEKVRDTVSPKQLLEFHPSQGWEPLCEFLDKPIPDEPFPHINGRTSIKIACFVLWSIVVLYHVCCAALAYHVIRKFVVPFTMRLKQTSR